MSRLRDAAAAWVEAGKWIGEADAYNRLAARIERMPLDCTARGFWATGPALELQAAVANVKRTREQAEQLMAELEHPGAALARRLVATYRGARAAWRGSR